MAEGTYNEFVFDEGPPLPTTVSLREARKRLGVRPLQLSEMIASGALETVKVGKADRVTMTSLRRHLPNEFTFDDDGAWERLKARVSAGEFARPYPD
jgi:hypothetical protein